MEWRVASDDDKNSFITRVKHDEYAAVFEPELMQLQSFPVMFYEDAELLLLENLICEPPFTLDYIRSGEEVVYMDGSAEPFKYLNEKGLLRLTPETVIDYLRTYLSYVVQPHVKIYLLQDPHLLPYHDSFYIDFNFDKNNYTDEDIKVSRNDYDNGYIVNAPFVFAGKIDPGIAAIDDNGDVRVEKAAGR